MTVSQGILETKATDRQLYNALIEATAASGATIFSTGKHEFHPHGLSAFVILGESHTALHSFPEDGKVWVEMVSCEKNIDMDVFFDVFQARVSGGKWISLDTQ